MGLTIHYSGQLKSPALIKDFVAELADVADSMGWTHQVINDDFSKEPDARLVHTSHGAEIQGNLGLKGISISPHQECEPCTFFFDRDGRLWDIVDAVGRQRHDKEYVPSVHVKTQFAPADVHISIIKLLKYLEKVYFARFQVKDEGSYWQTGDEKVLREKLAFLNEKLDQVAAALENSEEELKSAASESELADKIERILLERFKRRSGESS